VRRPDERREGRKLLGKCVVVHTGAEGEARASDLRNPPEAAERWVGAGHHAAADVIQHGRADLRGRVDRVGVRERAEQRIAFRAVISGDGAASGVGVESCGAVADGHKGVPELLLARRGHGTFHGRLESRIREWFDGD